MKGRIVFLIISAVFIISSSAIAANVVITCVPDGNEVTVSYVTSGTLIRAFGLTITLDPIGAPNNAITRVDVLDPNYRIFPSQIEMDGSEITNYGTPYDPCDLGDANLSIEMASLYTWDANFEGDANAGYGMQPGQSGDLLKFYISAVSADCNYTIDVDAATGGIVLEDPCETVIISSPLCIGRFVNCCDCMALTNPAYDNWVYWEKPPCWCYARQCRGDVDGLKFANVFWVSGQDLNILKGAINKPEAQIPPGGECADLDHLKFAGVFWVSGQDLNIMKQYINKPEPMVPPCGNPPDDYYYYWVSP